MRKIYSLIFGLLLLASPALAASRVTDITDNFPQANEDPLSSSATWRAVGVAGFDSHKVVSNQLQPNGTGATKDYITLNTTVLANDQWVQKTCTQTQGTGNFCGVVGRWAASATATGYVCAIADDGTIYLNKWVAGVQSTIATASYLWVNGDVVLMDLIGTAQTCYVNGSLKVTGGDTAIASGSAGVESYPVTATNEAISDDFLAGHFSAVATRYPGRAMILP